MKNSIKEKEFIDIIKIIFIRYPKVKSFGWSQYTPYYNDGNEIYFSVNTDYISINGELVDESITSYGTWNREKKVYEGRVEVPNLNYDAELAKAADEIRDFLKHFDDDFFLEQFGDHAEVVVTKDGVSINDCDHD